MTKATPPDAEMESILHDARMTTGATDPTFQRAWNACLDYLHERFNAALLSGPSVQVGDAPPVDVILHCRKCGMQHVDKADTDGSVEMSGRESQWDNPPHRSHLCHGCGYIWRDSDTPTNGVKAIKTKGSADCEPCEPIWERLTRERDEAVGKLYEAFESKKGERVMTSITSKRLAEIWAHQIEDDTVPITTKAEITDRLMRLMSDRSELLTALTTPEPSSATQEATFAMHSDNIDKLKTLQREYEAAPQPSPVALDRAEYILTAHRLGDMTTDEAVNAILRPPASVVEGRERKAYDALRSIAAFAPGNGDVCEIIAKTARTALAAYPDQETKS